MWKKSVDSEVSDVAPDQVPEEAESKALPISPKRNSASIIGHSIILKGDISGNEDLVVKGQIEGHLDLPNNDIKVDPEGQVAADFKAKKISIAGKVKGNLTGSELLIIEKSGQVEGNITAPRVVLEDGCQFKGSVEMTVNSGSNAGLKKMGVTTDQPKTSQGGNPSSNPGRPRASGTR